MRGNVRHIRQFAFRYLLLIAGFLVYSQSQAHHILGGEIQYTHVLANTYQFQVVLYRDCDKCEFNTSGCPDVKNLEIYASPEELSFAKRLKYIPLTKVTKTDITPVCNSVTSKCAGGTFPIGIEKWVYEGYVNFDTVSSEYCRFEVAIRIDSRADAYSQGTEEAFYNYARINICSGIANNSPKLAAPVSSLLQVNQSFTYNVLASDPDGDSLSYHLVKAQKAWNQNVYYPSSKTAKEPVTVNCPMGNCNLNKSSWPIEGSDIDPHSGWMGFTPITSGEAGYFVVEIREWRKILGTYKVVGVSRRDIVLNVLDAGNNIPKLSSSSWDYFACAGSDFMMDLGVLDQAYLGTKDSVKLAIWSDLPGGTISRVPGSQNQFDAFVTVPVSKNQVSENPYYITIVATDNHCPLMASTYKTISVTVTGMPNISPGVEYTECNKVTLNSGFSGSDYRQSWTISNNEGYFESVTGASGEIGVPKPGKYFVVYQLTNTLTNCQREILDSVIVPDFTLLNPNIQWPSKVCSNEVVKLTADFTGGTAPFVYWWNGVVGGNSNDILLNSDSVISCFVKDSKGCKITLEQKVQIFGRLTIAATDTSMCVPVASNQLNLKNRIVVSGWKDNGQLKLTYLSGNGNFTAPFTFEPLVSGKNHFEAQYIDKNNCHYTEPFSVFVIDPIPTGITQPAAFCSNGAIVDLNTATSCVLSNGEWTSTQSPNAISNKLLFAPNKAILGKQKLYYAMNLLGCLLRDTTEVEVIQAPTVQIDPLPTSKFCSSDADLTLTAVPDLGKWSNNVGAAMPNLWSPSSVAKLGKTAAAYMYTFTDITTGCTSSDTLDLWVNPAPKMDFMGDIELCEGDKIKLSPNASQMKKLTLIGDEKGIQVDKVASSFILTCLPLEQKAVKSFAWKIAALDGCVDQSKDFLITLRPKPELTVHSNPTAGCVPFTTMLEASNAKPKATVSQYIWNINGLKSVNPSITSMNVVDSGINTISVSGDYEGCTGMSEEIQIVGFSKPEALWSTNPKNRVATADYSNLYFINQSKSGVPYTLYWEFEKGTPAVSIKREVSVDFPKDTGLYQVKLTITSKDGCIDSEVKNIRIRPGLAFYAPTAFTPDQKGPYSNENFKITMDSVSQAKLTIRNRWGEILFSTSDLNEGWDGNYLGKTVPVGVYVWEIEANTIYGVYVRKAGTVLLVR